MDKMAGRNGGNGGSDTDGTAGIRDPSELAKQVNAFIEKLEADLVEVEGSATPQLSFQAFLIGNILRLPTRFFSYVAAAWLCGKGGWGFDGEIGESGERIQNSELEDFT